MLSSPPPCRWSRPGYHKFLPVLISDIFGNFHVQFEEKLLRDRSKAGVIDRGGEDFFFEKIRGGRSLFFQKMLGEGKRFFSIIKETGDKDFFSRKKK